MPVVAAGTLEAYANDAFVAAGAPEKNAGIVSEHLVGASLMGHDSHGVIRIPWYV